MLTGVWLLLVIAAVVYIVGSALYGVLEGCVRAFRAWRQYRDGRSASIHEAYRRLRNGDES